MAMEKLLRSKQKLQRINQSESGISSLSLKEHRSSKRPKFEQRHQRVTIYLLNSLYDEFMELRDQGYKQTDLMNEAVHDLIQKYASK
ncbi:hypothetical protein L1N85_16135 [Paenibacillus alkaliterrae]|uniref:hypothetical protein n=1 Tax=Paenibacillus alkaliterrae TaxID=320909 RepID=UPI001F3DEBFB|nr:hypothetical protein [Paenibacillus alkaliterrae]MCF2939947.1 hypothetical protein [Paenibacillus alkaliterrae]